MKVKNAVDLRFSRWRASRLRFPGTWHRVVLLIRINVSNVPDISILMAYRIL